MMKDNVITLNWDDEVLAKTVLTHDGKLHSDKTEHDAYPSNQAEQNRSRGSRESGLSQTRTTRWTFQFT